MNLLIQARDIMQTRDIIAKVYTAVKILKKCQAQLWRNTGYILPQFWKESADWVLCVEEIDMSLSTSSLAPMCVCWGGGGEKEHYVV